jgi:sec-independent protein translocase protein TatB
MFDIGWSELLVIGIVALIVIGPKELPGALRTLGMWMAKIRRMAAEFQGQFQEAMREAEIDQFKKEMDEMAAKAKDYGQFDPVEDVRRDIEKSMGDLPSLDPTRDTAATPAATDAQTPPQVVADAGTALTPPAEPALADAKPDARPDAGRAPV